MTFIDIRESALMAFDTVRSNKLRSALTILGVSVGVITVVFMVSIIQGLNKAFAAQIESLGSNTIWATKFDPSIGHQPTSEEIHRKELTIEDADAIRREAPSVVGVSPFYRKINETVRYADKQSDTPILIGVTPYHELTDILRKQRRVAPGAPNNFGISSQDALLDVYNQLTGATYLVLTAISCVALMIGGIGVMNIMLVSVTERTKEIGLRKAVGATRTNILSQFLIEAVVLTAIGGMLGLGIGELFSFLTNKYSPLPAYVPPWAICLGIGISAGVGIVFGLWPAWKAARLDPIESLRWE